MANLKENTALVEKAKQVAANGNTNGGEVTAAKPAGGNTIYDLINQMKGQIQKALPKHLDVERFTRIALTTVRMNPNLLNCTKESFLAAIMQSAQLGLEPSLLGQSYLVPYKNECKFIVGYQGMISLVRRSGRVKDIYSEIIYENDRYEIEFGLDRKLKHYPNFDGERGKPKFVYAVAKLEDNNVAFVILSMAEVEKVKKVSQAASSPYSPWQTWPEEMMKKTAIKRLCKYLPLSVEEAAAIQTDETIKKEIDIDMTTVPAIDISVEEAAA